MNKFLIKPQFQKATPNVLKGLKHYAEHGERALKNDKQIEVRLEPV